MHRSFALFALLTVFLFSSHAFADGPLQVGVHEVQIEQGKTGSSARLLRLLPKFDRAFPGASVDLIGSSYLDVSNEGSSTVKTKFGTWQIRSLGTSGAYEKLSLQKVGANGSPITFRVQRGSTFFVATDKSSDTQRGLAVHVHR